MIINNLSQRIRVLREKLGLSQNEFASKIERTSNFIAQIESGRSSISDKTKYIICARYHVNPNWLNNGTGEIFLPGFSPPTVDKAGIPLRIKTVRKEMKMTQDEFAKMVGCSKSQLTSVELGRVNPSNLWLSNLSESVGINNNWLLSGMGEMFIDKRTTKLSLDDINQFLQENPRPRHIVSEAISAYVHHQDDAIWDRIEESLRSDSKNK